MESARQTGTVMAELTAKAREAMSRGETRRSFFSKTATLAGATALGAAGAGFLQPIAARAASSTPSSDTVQDILNIACTAELLAVTLYVHAVSAGSQLPDVNSVHNQNYFQAAITQEYEHLTYLESLGGKALAKKFYFPENMFTDESVFFSTAITLEEYFISAYIAAAMDFSGAYSSGITTASPAMIGLAVQVAGVECEHRALLGVAANINPPNGVIIESALLTSVSDATTPLAPFLAGGSGFGKGTLGAPPISAIESLAGPYGASFFPKFTVV
jgi:rubrerythrin